MGLATPRVHLPNVSWLTIDFPTLETFVTYNDNRVSLHAAFKHLLLITPGPDVRRARVHLGVE